MTGRARDLLPPILFGLALLAHDLVDDQGPDRGMFGGLVALLLVKMRRICSRFRHRAFSSCGPACRRR